jgi:hypothetical protein
MKPTWRKVYDSRGSRVTIENGESIAGPVMFIHIPPPSDAWINFSKYYAIRKANLDSATRICGACKCPIDRYGGCGCNPPDA